MCGEQSTYYTGAFCSRSRSLICLEVLR